MKILSCLKMRRHMHTFLRLSSILTDYPSVHRIMDIYTAVRKCFHVISHLVILSRTDQCTPRMYMNIYRGEYTPGQEPSREGFRPLYLKWEDSSAGPTGQTDKYSKVDANYTQ